MFHKGGKEKYFAYSGNTACDKKGYVLDFHLDSGNKHDSAMLCGVYKKVKRKI